MRKPLPGRRPGLAAIVLAAGGSSRLGRPKQLLRWRNEPLIARAARLARQSVGGNVIVVLGAGRQRLRSLLRRRDSSLDIVCNARWPEGLASSLKAGLSRVPRSAAGVLIVLVDQPGIERADLARLVARWRARACQPAAAFYLGRAGVPAVIPRRLFKAVGTLEGDAGARQLLRNVGAVSLIDMPGAGFDIDTPTDAAVLSRSRRSRCV